MPSFNEKQPNEMSSDNQNQLRIALRAIIFLLNVHLICICAGLLT